MKRSLIIVLSIILVDLLFQQCANPISPKGGPRDTIPPTLQNANPKTGSINVNQQTITLAFDEFINADKLKQNLVITPRSKFTYKHQVKRMQLTLKFDQPFKDSTTYSINFFDGVTDITEKNPVVNLYLAFSTGSFIDSMKISGDVRDLFTNKPQDKFTVGLYPLTDSLDFLTDNPTYFTTTDEGGYYQLNYIKSGKYKIIAFTDTNRNLLLDPETEAHGFLSDTINLLTTDSAQYSLRTQILNVKPIKFINARPIAQYIEAKYSREISDYSISPDSLASITIGDNKDVIRIYNKTNRYNYGDSIQMILTAFDSLGNYSTDTIKTAFLESSRKLPSFKSSITTKSNQVIQANQKINIEFNKPIVSIDSTKFSFFKDSTFFYPVTPTFQWNEKRNRVTISTNINLDTLLSQLHQSLPKDTTSTISDTTDTNKVARRTQEPNNTSSTSINFQMQTGAFISLENDTTKNEKLPFKTSANENYGVLNINVSTENNSFIVQLLSKGQISYQSINSKKISFPRVKPGTYAIRVLIDDNEDGIWSHGNILKNEEPETIFLYPSETSMRENWVIDLDITF